MYVVTCIWDNKRIFDYCQLMTETENYIAYLKAFDVQKIEVYEVDALLSTLFNESGLIRIPALRDTLENVAGTIGDQMCVIRQLQQENMALRRDLDLASRKLARMQAGNSTPAVEPMFADAAHGVT